MWTIFLFALYWPHSAVLSLTPPFGSADIVCRTLWVDDFYLKTASFGRVAELVYAHGLGPCGAIRGGSSPLSPTKRVHKHRSFRSVFCLYNGLQQRILMQKSAMQLCYHSDND